MATRRKSLAASLLGSSATIQREEGPFKAAPASRPTKAPLFEEIKAAGDNPAQVILCDDRESALLIARFAVGAVWGADARNMLKVAQAARERFPDSELIAAFSAGNSRLVGELAGKGVKVLAAIPDTGSWSDVANEHGTNEARRRFDNAVELARLLDRVEGRISRGRVFQPMDANAILNADYSDPVWAVDQLIPAGVTLLASRPKKGKSWLALQMGRAVAQGVPFMGLNTKRGPVFYAALEDTPRRLQKRMQALGVDELTEATRGQLLFTTSFPALSAEIGIPQLAKIIVEKRPSLVIFDVWRRCQPEIRESGLNAQQKDYKAIFPLTCLAAEANTAILVLTHQNKQASKAGEMLDGVADSLGLSGAVDGIITLNRDGQSETAFLRKEGREYEDTNDIHMVWQPGGGWRLASAQEVKDRADKAESETKRKIRQVLESSVDEVSGAFIPLSYTEIINRSGFSRGKVSGVLSRMKACELVIQTKEGKYIPNPVFTSTYTPNTPSLKNNNNNWSKSEATEASEAGEASEAREALGCFAGLEGGEAVSEAGAKAVFSMDCENGASVLREFRENDHCARLTNNSQRTSLAARLAPYFRDQKPEEIAKGLTASIMRLQRSTAEIEGVNRQAQQYEQARLFDGEASE